MVRKSKIVLIAVIAAVILAAAIPVIIAACDVHICSIADGNCNCVIICNCGNSTKCYVCEKCGKDPKKCYDSCEKNMYNSSGCVCPFGSY